MVHAVIHIICGNCGSTDIQHEGAHWVEDDQAAFVYLACNNCATLHTIGDIKGLKTNNNAKRTN